MKDLGEEALDLVIVHKEDWFRTRGEEADLNEVLEAVTADSRFERICEWLHLDWDNSVGAWRTLKAAVRPRIKRYFKEQGWAAMGSGRYAKYAWLDTASLDQTLLVMNVRFVQKEQDRTANVPWLKRLERMAKLEGKVVLYEVRGDWHSRKDHDWSLEYVARYADDVSVI